jgi:predicted transcriptional regulator
LKQRAAEWIVARRSAGATVAEVSAELGLSAGTVLKWSAQQKRRRALVPVQVVPDVAERPISIVAPSGFRLEGLTITEAAALLRALG